MNFNTIKYFFETGVFDVYKVVEFVDNKVITEEEFHMITGYNYSGIKSKEG